MADAQKVLVMPTWRKPLAFLFGAFGGFVALGLDAILIVGAISEFSQSAPSPSRSGRMEVAAVMIGIITLYLPFSVIVLVYFSKDAVRISFLADGSATFTRRGDSSPYILETIREGSWGWLPIAVLEGSRGNEKATATVSPYWPGGQKALRDLKATFKTQ